MLLLLCLLVQIQTPPAWWIDGTPLIPGLMEIDRIHDPAFRPSRPPAGTDSPAVGTQVNFWSIDYSSSPYGEFYLTPATCRFVGERTYIFVEDAVWDIHYDQAAVDAFAAALEDSTPAGDSGIVVRDTGVFGPVPDAIDGDPKVYFLVLDIRDGFDPSQGGAYFAGFFSPYNQFTDEEAYLYYGGHSNEVEMLYIDCKPGDADDAAYTASHELVHLIQWGVEPFSGEELWVVENQAQAGTFVCGYPAFQVETFLEVGGVTPIKWTNLSPLSVDYVAGYGAGFLFFSWLTEHYGGEAFLYHSLRSLETGVSGVSEAIEAATGRPADMAALLGDWMLACWIDDPDFGDGLYGWEAFRIADYDTVSPGNRPGLDYTGEIETVPYQDLGVSMSSYQGRYYRLGDGLEGSFRAAANGLGDLAAFFFDGQAGSIEPVVTGAANDAALSLPAEGDVLLLCRSFAGLALDVAAGSVAGSAGEFAVFPQPCTGTLYFQFLSNGESAVLSVFSLGGGLAETVEFGPVASGEATLGYEGASGLASGVYLFRFAQGGRTETGSFAIVR
jgi:hypothetical protein